MKKSLYIERILEVTLLVIPALLLIPGSGGFPYPSPTAAYSDLSISHYPNALYLQRSIIEQRTVPLWSSTILSGYPFLANPLSGALYPVNWFLILLPLPFGLNLLAFVHLIIGTFGVLVFLESQGSSKFAARFGALCFALMPKWYAHFGAGHYSLLIAFCWTPWLLLAAYKNVTLGNKYQYKIHSWRESIILSMMILADIRWSIYGILLWTSFRLWREYSCSAETLKTMREWILQSGVFIFRVGMRLIKGILVSAPLWIPLIEFVMNSTRNQLNISDNLVFSFPASRLLGVFFPDFGGFFEWSFYPGICVLLLASISFSVITSKWWNAFWGWVVVVSILLALGDANPMGTLIYRLPIIDLLRVPARALFLSSICIIFLAAKGLDGLLTGNNNLNIRFARLLCLALAAFSLTICATAGIIQQSLPPNFLWGAIGIFICSISVLGLTYDKFRKTTGVFILVIVNLADLFWVSHSYFIYKAKDEVLSQGRSAAEFIQQDHTGSFRVYSPSYSIPQQTAADLRIELSDGIDPMQIGSYVQFMERATGVPMKEYSVTLPPYKSGSPESDNVDYSPSAAALGLINVKYLVSEYKIKSSGFQQVEGWKNPYIYINSEYMPRAWIQETLQSPSNTFTPVDSFHKGPNSFEISANGPGILVLSEIYYPGWKAFVNGKPVDIFRYENILRGIPIGSGVQSIRVLYEPLSLLIGVLCLSLALAWLSIDLIRYQKIIKRGTV